MTCSHVLGLIDAGPLADCPRAHLDAAWRHAHECATCGPALQAATTLTAGLAALPRPASPPDLESIIMARIARIEEDRTPAFAGAVTNDAASIRSGGWPAWAALLGGLAAGLAIFMAMPRVDIASPRVGGLTAGLVPMPSPSAWALVLAGGLLLYVAGLFGSVTACRRPPR
jgi:hypothetical protein